MKNAKQDTKSVTNNNLLTREELAKKMGLSVPTTTIFDIHSDDVQNNASEDYIAYCWADVQGFSKIGSYKGSGNANGPFIYTGFRPAWLIVKNVTQAGSKHWGIQDSKRDTYNPVINSIDSDDNYAAYDATSRAMDFLSNGFKARTTDSEKNTDGETFVYMAFAESPFVNSNGVPTNAR